MQRSRALSSALTLAAWLSPALLPAIAAPGSAPDAAVGSDASARGDAAQALFEQVLRRLSGYKDFQARFVESSESRAGTRAARESGQVFFKRPGLWRWEYTDPERKVVRVRGRDAEIAIEGDPQVSRYDLGPGDGPAGIGALLSGGESLSRSFSARFEKGGDPQTPVLRLDPLALSEDFEYLLVRVRRSDLTVLEVVIVDPGGNRLRFQFDDLRQDRGLADALFQFADPPAAGKGSSAPSASPGKP